jgi:hypothetical protein
VKDTCQGAAKVPRTPTAPGAAHVYVPQRFYRIFLGSRSHPLWVVVIACVLFRFTNFLARLSHNYKQKPLKDDAEDTPRPGPPDSSTAVPTSNAPLSQGIQRK